MASLCLPAAFITLLTPLLFLLHLDYCRAYLPAGGNPLRLTASNPTAGQIRHHHPRAGSAHHPDACMLCQAFFQIFSGVTFASAREAVIPAPPAPFLRAEAAPSPRGERPAVFLSRAPPSSAAIA